MTKPRVVVVGSTNIDLIARVPHLPRPGETVSDGQFMQAFGGKGANAAVGAQRAGGEVAFVTATGNDSLGEQVRTALADEGIDLSQAVVAEAATGTALILVDPEGQNCIAVAPGANDHLRPEHVSSAASLIQAAEVVVLQMEVPLETVESALELASSHGVRVVLNYAPVRSTQLRPDARLFALVVNEGEAEALSGVPVSGVDSAFIAAHRLRSEGVSVVVVTLGHLGSVVVAEGVEAYVPAFPVAAVDATAAGDIFCGAFAVACAEQRELVEAVRFATAASAISVTRVGAQPSAPTRSEILGLLSGAVG